MNGYRILNGAKHFAEDGSQNDSEFGQLSNFSSNFYWYLVTFLIRNPKNCQRNFLKLQLHQTVTLSQYSILLTTEE